MLLRELETEYDSVRFTQWQTVRLALLIHHAVMDLFC